MFYLETKNVIKKYANHLALDRVNIQVKPGSIYGLLGPNGAGKTTLIRIINRITAPDSGEVYINGALSTQQNIYNIGYLPEERGLYKKMKVGEQVLFLSELKGIQKNEAKSRIDYWFKKFDILSWKDKKVEELSKGMQQKVQFIATVIHEPELLILDEPFSGFDPVNAELLKNEVLEQKAKGKTIILSTHNMESVESLCDEISLINKSQVVLQGDVSEIKNNHKSNIYIFKIKSPDFNFESPLFTVISKSAENEYMNIKIQKDNNTAINDIIKIFIDQFEVISFEEELPTMNEIFIKTVTTKA